jgi:DNA-binding CsgD family transcriptional regulator
VEGGVTAAKGRDQPLQAGAGQLAERDLHAVLDLVGEAHDTQDLDEFRSVIVAGFRRLIPADYCSYNEVHADGRTPVSVVEPDVPVSILATWERRAAENPLVQRFMTTRDGRAFRFSDTIALTELRRTEIFRELYAPLGIDRQLAFALPSPPELIVGLALSRGGRDFTERDRRMVDLTRPHLIQAYRNAALRERLVELLDSLRRGLEVGGMSIVVLDEHGCVAFATTSAREMVGELAGRTLEDGRPLPEPLAGWASSDVATTSLPIAGRADAVLARRVRGSGQQPGVILLERAGRVLSTETLRGLGLTERESAVLHGLARGLETEAVATDLGISPRTVYKHAEHVHAKLGVRTRAQAVATAWAAAGR